MEFETKENFFNGIDYESEFSELSVAANFRKSFENLVLPDFTVGEEFQHVIKINTLSNRFTDSVKINDVHSSCSEVKVFAYKKSEKIAAIKIKGVFPDPYQTIEVNYTELQNGKSKQETLNIHLTMKDDPKVIEICEKFAANVRNTLTEKCLSQKCYQNVELAEDPSFEIPGNVEFKTGKVFYTAAENVPVNCEIKHNGPVCRIKNFIPERVGMYGFEYTYKVDYKEVVERADFIKALEDPAIKERKIFEDFCKTITPRNGGRVGRELNFEIDFPCLKNLEKLKILEQKIKFENLKNVDAFNSGIQLDYDSENAKFRITGCPLSVEDEDSKPLEKVTVQLVLKYSIEYVNEKTESDKKELPVLVISDPKAMFKDKNPPENDPYYSPNTDEKFIREDSSKGILKSVVAASRRGRSHANVGSFRDDNFKVDYLENSGWYIVVVSDGAGSAEFSRKGSEIACTEFCDTLKSYLELDAFKVKLDELVQKMTGTADEELENLKGNLVQNVKNFIWRAGYQGYCKISEEAAKKGVEPKKYAATLLGFVLKKIGSEWLVVSLCVGDGAIAMLDANEFLIPLSVPDGGENVGETRFVTMPSVWGVKNNVKDAQSEMEEQKKRIFTKWVGDFKCIMSMSDGVGDPKFGTDENLQKVEIWQKLWDEVYSAASLNTKSEDCAAKLVEWLNFYIDTHHDDRTLAIVY